MSEICPAILSVKKLHNDNSNVKEMICSFGIGTPVRVMVPPHSDTDPGITAPCRTEQPTFVGQVVGTCEADKSARSCFVTLVAFRLAANLSVYALPGFRKVFAKTASLPLCTFSRKYSCLY